MLDGLASKLLRYAEPASNRRAVRLLRQRGYPTHIWDRAFGCELLRQGAPMGCLMKASGTEAEMRTSTVSSRPEAVPESRLHSLLVSHHS